MPQKLFTDLSILVQVSLNELLEQIHDPQSELQEKISVLSAAWKQGRHELATAGAALSAYQEKETAIQTQIDFHEKQAELFVENDTVAYNHLLKAKECGESLERARKATAEFNEELEKQRLTLDAVAERIETLQKAYDKIKLIDGRAEQLEILREVAAEEENATELEASSVKRLYTAEARLELAGIDVPGEKAERDPELVAKLEELRRKRG